MVNIWLQPFCSDWPETPPPSRQIAGCGGCHPCGCWPSQGESKAHGMIRPHLCQLRPPAEYSAAVSALASTSSPAKKATGNWRRRGAAQAAGHFVPEIINWKFYRNASAPWPVLKRTPIPPRACIRMRSAGGACSHPCGQFPEGADPVVSAGVGRKQVIHTAPV